MQFGAKRAVKPRSVNYSNVAPIMRTEIEPHLHVPLDRSKTARRRRSLHRGHDAWRLAHRAQEKRVRRAFILSLTQAAQDPIQLAGHLRRFTHALRRRWPDAWYEFWLEKQNDAAFNYHGQVAFPGSSWKGFSRAWVAREWRQGFVNFQPRTGDWWRQQGTGYVHGYVKKMGEKAWQQSYEDAPRELRTFANERLAGGSQYWYDQLQRYDVVYIPPRAIGARWISEHLVLTAVLSGARHSKGIATRYGRSPPYASSPRRLQDLENAIWRTDRDQVVKPSTAPQCAFGCRGD